MTMKVVCGVHGSSGSASMVKYFTHLSNAVVPDRYFMDIPLGNIPDISIKSPIYGIFNISMIPE